MTIVKNLTLYDVFSDKVRLGRQHDGGYIINKTILEKANELISLGSENEYSFETDWMNNKNGAVLIFDGSCDCTEFCEDHPDVVYNKQFVKTSANLNEILKNRRDVLLKIDIEGDEYEVLRDCDLSNIIGLNIEFHGLKYEQNRLKLNKLLTSNFSNFLIYHIHSNSHGELFDLKVFDEVVMFPETLEISLINKRYVSHYEIDLKNTYPIKNLDFSNHPQKSDHPLPWINNMKWIQQKKVSFVCTSYRRFTCVERIIAQYHAQTYPNKELIILNTDMEHPFTLGFEDETIKVINNDIDYHSGSPYKNRGQICRDAVVHATGDYFMLADDDDIYLPWHLEQAVDGIELLGTDAWKPEQSFFAQPSRLSLTRNTMEASVIVKMSRIREIGFRTDLTGYEGLSWYVQLRNEGQLDEHNKYYVPSYCFNWSDPHELGGHKQSGDIDNPNNFENHKKQSMDYAKRPLQKGMDLTNVYKKYYDFYKENLQQFNHELIQKYVAKHLT